MKGDVHTVVDEECHHGVALIALELEHLAHLLILDDAPVAAVDLPWSRGGSMERNAFGHSC